MAPPEKIEIRSIIKFCQELGDTPSKTYEKIVATKGEHSVSRAVVFSWHKRFKEGTTSITDKDGRGRNKKTSQTLVTSIAEALNNDRRLTLRTLSAMFQISYGTTQSILTKDLQMRKVS